MVPFFSLATPAGIGIGWLVEKSGSGSIGAAVCTALAGGTFLWAAVMEFIPHVFASDSRLLGKCLFFVSGFALMSVMAMWCCC